MRSDFAACLRTVNEVLSQIPPYALYTSHRLLRSSRDTKSIYEIVYLQSDTDIGERIRTSWLQDLHFYKHMLYNINLPFAVRVELSVCDMVGVVVLFCFNFNAQAFSYIITFDHITLSIVFFSNLYLLFIFMYYNSYCIIY